MAISTPTAETVSGDAATATSITSGTFDVDAGDLIVVFASQRGATLGTPTVSSTMTTPLWTVEASDGVASANGIVAAWCIAGKTETGRTVTIDFGVSSSRHTIHVCNIASGMSFMDAVVQAKTGTQTTGTTMTLTLDNALTSGSILIGAIANNGGSVIAPVTGVELNEQLSGGGSSIDSEVQYVMSPGSTSVQWAGLASNNTAAVLLEIRPREAAPASMVPTKIAPSTALGPGSSITSPAVKPFTSNGLLCIVAGSRSVASIVPTISTTGLDIGSWQTYTRQRTGTQPIVLIAFAVVNSTAAGSVTVDWGTSQARQSLQVFEIDGQDTSASPYVQSGAVDGATTTPLSVTLGSAPRTDSIIVMAALTSTTSAGDAITAAGGFAEVDEVQAGPSTYMNVALLYDSAPPASTTQQVNNQAASSAMIAVEIGVTQPPPPSATWLPGGVILI